MHALVDLFAQLRYLRLADAGQPHRLHQIVDPAGRHTANPGLLDHRNQRLLRTLASLQKWREIAALPQFWDAQLQRAKPRVESAVAVAIAPGRALAATLVAPGADQPLNVGFHQHCSTASATARRKSPSPAFSSSSASTNLSSVIVSSRVLQVEVLQLHLSRPDR